PEDPCEGVHFWECYESGHRERYDLKDLPRLGGPKHRYPPPVPDCWYEDCEPPVPPIPKPLPAPAPTPTPPPGPGPSNSSALAGSFDPNDKLAPAGYGDAAFVQADGSLSYQVRF